MKNNELAKRWKEFPSLNEILQSTRKFKVSPFGRTEDGLLDFRGVSLISKPFDVGGGWDNEIHRIDLCDADFSFGAWKGFDIGGARIRNCKFNSVEFVGEINFHGTCLEECVFNSCSFQNVHFVKSSIKNTRFGEMKNKNKLSFNVECIDGCSFDGKMKGIDFKSSPIKNTSFSGELVECVFFGNPFIDVVDADKGIYGRIEPHAVVNRMEGVDFSAASLTRCHFSNYCYLDKVVPPSSENNCISFLAPEFYEKANDLMKTEMPLNISKKALMWLETFYKPDVRIPYGVIGPQDLEKPLGQEGAKLFFELFRRAAIDANSIV